MDVILNYGTGFSYANTVTMRSEETVVGPYLTPPVIGTQTTIGGATLTGYNKVTSGTDNTILGPGEVALCWYDNSTGTLLQTWSFDTTTTLNTAITAINTALAAGAPSVTVTQ